MPTLELVPESSRRLRDQVAVITGATSGIALAAARLFAAHGAQVVITGRDERRLDRAVAELQEIESGAVLGVRGDAGNLNDLEQLFTRVRETHGRVDVLYASAGIPGVPGTVAELAPDDFDAVLRVNVRGTFFTVQKALELMPDGARIALGGSVAAGIGQPGASVYGASKAAIRAFARTWAMELAPRRIRVNVLTVGPTDTPGMRDAVPSEQQRAAIAERIPVGRWGEPAEQAAAALFLASADSSFVTGAELAVDGGFAQI